MNTFDSPLLSATNQWDRLPDMTRVRSDFAAVTFEGRVFAIGGFNGTEVLSSIEYYEPEDGTWRVAGHLSTPRSGTR